MVDGEWAATEDEPLETDGVSWDMAGCDEGVNGLAGRGLLHCELSGDDCAAAACNGCGGVAVVARLAIAEELVKLSEAIRLVALVTCSRV